jgi:hypothetical protein
VVAVGRERSDAPSQEKALELLNVAVRSGHGAIFAASGQAPADRSLQGSLGAHAILEPS